MERKEAIEIVRNNFSNGRTQLSEALKTLIPELNGSEDEKIREKICKLLWDNAPHKEAQEYIAWLEKQGDYNRLVEEIKERKKLLSKEKEKATSTNDKLSLGGRIAILGELLAFTGNKQGGQKETLCDKCRREQPSHSCQDITSLGRCSLEHQGEQILANSAKTCKDEQKHDNKSKPTEHSYITPNSKFFQWIYDRLKNVYNENPNVDYMLSLKERIEDMQEHADNVEPKFKVGDWISNGVAIWHIEEVNGKEYILGGISGVIKQASILFIDSKFHLWTIQDAKDGDVLYCKKRVIDDNEVILMYSGINIRNNVDSYCRYNSKLGFNTYITNVLDAERDFITPATKEQRDFLFQKIKESDLEWDDKKKELKEIE